MAELRSGLFSRHFKGQLRENGIGGVVGDGDIVIVRAWALNGADDQVPNSWCILGDRVRSV